jgi:membrane protein
MPSNSTAVPTPRHLRLRGRLLNFREHVAEAYRCFETDDGEFLAGGIAFFSVLSMAPMLVIALALASRMLGGRAVSGVLVAELRPILGDTSAAFVAEMIERTEASGISGHAAFLGALVTIYASTRLFLQVQIALNRVWGMNGRETGSLKARAVGMLRKRLVSFALVLALGIILASLVVAKTVLSHLANRLGLPHVPFLWRAVDLGISFAALTLMVAVIYRFLPDARIGFRPALRGALMTSLFLTAGTLLVGMYLDSFGVATAFGAAGSLVVFMLSAYYGAQIFLFGAELTGVSARREGLLTPSTPPRTT